MFTLKLTENQEINITGMPGPEKQNSYKIRRSVLKHTSCVF